MSTLSRLILYCGLVNIQVYSVTSVNIRSPSTIATKTFNSADGSMGMTSVAEVTSKDGKIFSTGGVKFYPPIGTKLDRKSNFMEPWTFSRQTNDGVVMGGVGIYPGGVMASAVSFGSPKNDLRQINPIGNWPLPRDLFPRMTFPSSAGQQPLLPTYTFNNFNPFVPFFGDVWFPRIYNPFLDIWQ